MCENTKYRDPIRVIVASRGPMSDYKFAVLGATGTCHHRPGDFDISYDDYWRGVSIRGFVSTDRNPEVRTTSYP